MFYTALYRGLCIFILLPVSICCCAQQNNPALAISARLPGKYFSTFEKAFSSANERLSRRSVKYLAKFQRREKRLMQKMQAFIPKSYRVNIPDEYSTLATKMHSEAAELSHPVSGEYGAHMDSLGATLTFLRHFSADSNLATGALKEFTVFQNKLIGSSEIEKFIAGRRADIKSMISAASSLPARMIKDYDELGKAAYYYSAQVKEYKEMFKDPVKLEEKALSVLRQLPEFQKFMKENSSLSALFNLRSNYGTAGGVEGLQTRTELEDLVSNRLGAGPNGQKVFAQQVNAAQQGLLQLKERLASNGESADINIPGFKPNSQTTKAFGKRLEYGFNIQFSKTNSLLPSVADVAASIGYKLNDKSISGIGVSYKLGIASHQGIAITSQGIGLRTFVDYKIKGQFYGNAGYEINYNSAFKSIEALKNYSAWQKSCLAGMSKKYKITKKVKGEIKLLYDFLAYSHLPSSAPFLFRVGYTF
jgi:hypothetical protein